MGDSIFFSVTDPDNLDSVSWDFGDPGSGAYNTSTDLNPYHTYSLPGTYNVQLTKYGSCELTFARTVIIYDIPQIDLGKDTSICQGNTLILNAQTPAATYLWQDGSVKSSFTLSSAGTYWVEVTNACGPSKDTITVSTYALAVATDSMHVTCFGGNDGSAVVNASGGFPPYTYLWNDPGAQQTATATALLAGTYQVTITDSRACETNVIVNISQPSALVINAEVIPVKCFGGNDGSAMVIASGGTAPYTYAWSPAVSTKDTAINLSAASYTAVISDANNCSGSIVVTISQPDSLTLEVTGGSTCQGQNAILTASAAGGTPPYIYNWNPGAMQGASVNVSPSDTITYTVEVEDANKCTAPAQSATLYVFPAPLADFTMTPPHSAPVSSPVAFNDHSTGADYWLWNFGDIINSGSAEQEPSFTYTELGSYTITLIVSTHEGCSDTVSHTMIIDPDFSIYIPNTFTPDSDGLNDSFAPKGLEFESFEMEIYNRWGEKIYHTTDIDKPWDGRKEGRSEISKPDVYEYKIRVMDFKNQILYYLGNVTLIK